MLIDRARAWGREQLRLAIEAFAARDDSGGSAAARRARTDLEDAVLVELDEDAVFASKLRILGDLFAALSGPRLLRLARENDDDTETRESSMPSDVALWVATAAGSGILGDAAYDALKAAVRKHMHSEDKPGPAQPVADGRPDARYSAEQLTLIAQLAVQARCGELSIVPPRVAELRRIDMTAEETSAVIVLEAPRLQARVIVPADGVTGARDISVTLYAPSLDRREPPLDW